MPDKKDNSTEPRGERHLIERLRQRCQPPTLGTVPFGDDMAGIDARGTLATTDMLMDGVDFDIHQQPLDAIGYKCMAVNLSDCAAMAALPNTALVAVALPNDWSMAQAESLFAGMQACAAEFNCPIVGGDTNAWSQPLVVSITVTAAPFTGAAPVRRDGAQIGDTIYVSGPLGGSLLGRHLKPRPRLELAAQLAQSHQPTAMIDISDGLAVDLNHILTASNCAAELDEAALQTILHPDALAMSKTDGRTPLEHALHDGEDFELIITHAPLAEAERHTLGLFAIGKITAGSGLVRIADDGTRIPVPPVGWEHFQ